MLKKKIKKILYFTGNSLGLQPKKAGEYIQEELADWAKFGVEGHFHAKRPWYSYHENLCEMTAKIVGAKPVEVVVTHSPRYLIDMNLEKGKTIFDKINLSYDTLRKKDNPIKPIVDYYKGKLKPGEELWWMDNENNSNASNIVIRIWNNLSAKEKQLHKNRAMVFFPELFGNRTDKFGRLAIWLVTREAVVCPNVRDLFTAGGKSDCIIGRITYHKVPRIFLNLFDNITIIVEIIMETSAYELSEYWETKTTETTKIFDWINLVAENAKRIRDANHLNIKQMLTDLTLK